jgi:hemoglobin
VAYPEIDAKTESTTAPPQPVPSLFEWSGGMPALERLTEHFYDRVRRDEVLATVFAQMGPEHPKHVAHFLAEVLRGPAAYTAERGGHVTMLTRHLGRRLTQVQRARWVTLLLESADEVKLPDDPEFRSAFVAYLEWGSRLAVLNSQDGVTPVLDQPMPSWGWGEIGGPYRP